ncbi:GIY-YIG nuclease family protein [Hoeflea sp.]|uniref:GIY-YIG nuclease family protein n=1 Tax=Hoeflea sp. TaxID=1940281 RepID=UPI001997FCA1|nr:GIY-YIG nuclease family protein [Hoeflea sp.]MBC7281860.1 GIY-YIG nuclease family protein [Hoeflea sp.]
MSVDILDLHEVLISCGKERSEDVKLYRHANHKRSVDRYGLDLEEMIRTGDLEIYQSVQRNRQLGEGLVAFFMGESGRLSRFLGVWQVTSIHDWQHDSPRAAEARDKKYLRDDGIWHELEHDARFDAFANRLIIEWPEAGRHHQWLVENGVERRRIQIREIRAIGIHRPFPGFDDVILGYGELKGLIGSDAGGWKEALSSTRGVYLITDTERGDLYVGSATGANGIWERWSNYVSSGHGGNKVMIDRVAEIVVFADNLQFSVIETLGNLASRADGIAAEVRWKKKLGKRATVLNGN